MGFLAGLRIAKVKCFKAVPTVWYIRHRMLIFAPRGDVLRA
jgi:hypothetical protein